ncbi:hypothetical protein Tco_1343387 [Tanacetum coccineum]
MGVVSDNCREDRPSEEVVELASTDDTDSGPGSSFEEPASLEYTFGLGRACLVRVTSYVYPLEVSEETVPHHFPSV